MDKKYFQSEKLLDLKHNLSQSNEVSFQQGYKYQEKKIKSEKKNIGNMGVNIKNGANLGGYFLVF